MFALEDILADAVRQGASDIHFKVGKPPIFRVGGDLCAAGCEAMTPENMHAVVRIVLPPHLAQAYADRYEADFSLDAPSGRFRVNLFRAQGDPAIVMRHVKSDIPTVEELRLPARLKDLARVPRGIIILCGTTGCGKSTTLAAIIGEINRTQRRRIVTVEDPVEYLFADDKSIITQREVGLDTLDYTYALTHLMRQDPDVVLIGEMRDLLSIRTALLAAETGHVVFTTLHAKSADLAVPRILDVFSAEERDQIRMGLAANLHAAVCQRLIPDLNGRLVPAVEILINTPTVRKLLQRNQLDTIEAAITTGREDGMQTFNQAVYDLLKSGTINEAAGMRFATNPESLRMNLKGIFLDESRRILSR
jgi:pilus retraction protein PilT